MSDSSTYTLKDKHILLGICGSIAAYKAAFLTRLLVRSGASVRIIMTNSATAFIAPLTLSTLSKNPVLTDFVDQKGNTWNNHVELGLWADVFLIAPATANTLAKMANGLCDNLMTATYLSARCPVYAAPAMDLDMWQHPTTRKNIQTLTENDVQIISVESGELASGLEGEGRMAEPEHILDLLQKKNSADHRSLTGRRVLITAGPTYEPIDPVRFIGNRSSGKMGLALAEEAAHQGASVTLVKGPTSLDTEHPNIRTIAVDTAHEMYKACLEHFPDCDAAILSAAVADYTPQETATQKIKKSNGEMTLSLKKTRDILKTLGQNKENRILVGFALETEHEEAHAQKKLLEKNLDFIVLNSLNDAGAGFQHDTNKITILDKDNKTKRFELKKKTDVARDIIRELSAYFND